MNIQPTEKQESLHKLLLDNGIAESFIDFSGNIVRIPLENRLRVLANMGIIPSADGKIDNNSPVLSGHETYRLTQPIIVLLPDTETLFLKSPGDKPNYEIHWTIFNEAGSHDSGVVSLSEEAEGATIRFFPLCAGYYHLELSYADLTETCLIIVAPGKAWEPEFLNAGKRLWGVSTQLFSLTSDNNLGIGDFTDLEQLVIEVAAKGGDFVLVNPLHALDIQYPENSSPYSPADRRYLNPLYIDPARTPEFSNQEFMDWYSKLEITNRAEQLRKPTHIQYSEVQNLKYVVFSHLYEVFKNEKHEGALERQKQFRDFVAKREAEFQGFAEYMAGRDLRKIALADEPEFHLYLQWLAQTQLDEVQARAIAEGMAIGLIRDMAVGAADDSFEVSSNQQLFCREARIGAPPDHFNPQGQNWGLPPMSPKNLEKSEFRHFIQLLRANMRACGALRLDHILSLMRLWWCPVGGNNADGAYVHYNTDALFAILRLESNTAHCMIIGEDLGVVPPEINGYMADSGILSNTIFYFEKYDGISFRKPEHYNPRALAIIANHDVPTLRAWWNMNDLALRQEIGLLADDDAVQQEYANRVRDKHCLLNLLDEVHLLPEEWLDHDISKPFDLSLSTAIIRTCARSVSCLVSIQVDDLAGLETPVNIPGTDTEYKNWRRKVPVSVHSLFSSDIVKAMLAPLSEERPRC